METTPGSVCADTLGVNGEIWEEVLATGAAVDHQRNLFDLGGDSVLATRDAALGIISRAKRPLLFVDVGVRWGSPFAAPESIVSELKLPFVCGPMARGYVSDFHTLCFNTVRSHGFAQAVLILLMGGRLDWQWRYGAEFSPHAAFVQICIASEPTTRYTADANGWIGVGIAFGTGERRLEGTRPRRAGSSSL